MVGFEGQEGGERVGLERYRAVRIKLFHRLHCHRLQHCKTLLRPCSRRPVLPQPHAQPATPHHHWVPSFLSDPPEQSQYTLTRRLSILQLQKRAPPGSESLVLSRRLRLPVHMRVQCAAAVTFEQQA